MVGTIFRLPDEMQLQRGITFTILPDGRSLRVPAMSRLEVRAQAQSHEEDDDGKMVQALQDILAGKKPVAGRARINRRGRAHRIGGGRGPMQGGPAPFDPHGGLRPAGLEAGGYGNLIAES